MGPKSGSATPSPRKSRTTKKLTPAGTDAGAADDEEGAGSSTPASGSGNDNGQGKARKEKDVCESPSKKIKTEDADPSPSLIPVLFEIRVPPPASPVHLKTDDEHADP